jgi:hypothetical protein
MNRSILALSGIFLLTAQASAQAPLWVDLGPGTTADDVTTVNGEVLVVGVTNGSAYRWSSISGSQLIGGYNGSANLRISDNGTVVMSDHVGLDGISRAALWSGGTTWTDIPGIGGVSSGSETGGSALSGDGTTIVGLGWVAGGTGHAFRSSGGTTIDLTPPFSMPSSRASGVDDSGSLVVGWDQSQRYGTRWVNGVKSYFVYTAPSAMQYATGEASAVNGPGTVAVGSKIFTLAVNDGWRWDSGTNAITRLSNLAGQVTTASPTDVTDDGSLIVGHSGGNVLGGTLGVIWIQNQPVSLHGHLIGLGCAGAAAYSDVGLVTSISGDGLAICGQGTGLGLNQPNGGWVVYFPGAFDVGTVFCSGDGTGTVCPCANGGTAGNGCASSVNANGAHLIAQGVGGASISNDTITLAGSGMPNSSALYFQGTTRQNGGLGSLFGDGLRCAGGTTIRLGTKSNAGGASEYPAAGETPVSVRGLVTTPGTRTYQCWYRNAAAFCTASTFNFSNGIELDWMP